MLPIIIATLAGIITFALLDYLWLAHIAKEFYLNRLGSHVTITDGSLVPYLPAVPLVYGVAIFALWVFVLSWAVDVKQAALYGTLFGFCMYAFYDFTNLATLKGYTWPIALVDSLWGAFAVGVVTIVMFLVKGAIS